MGKRQEGLLMAKVANPRRKAWCGGVYRHKSPGPGGEYTYSRKLAFVFEIKGKQPYCAVLVKPMDMSN